MRRSKEELTITHYLLGQADEVEQARIEKRYFHDPGYHEQILALEDELIRAYLLDELPADERRLFERHFLASARRREKYEFTQRLMTYANDATATVSVRSAIAESFSWWSWLLPIQPKLAWAAVGGVLILCGGIWWMLRPVQVPTTANNNDQAKQVVAEKRVAPVEQQSPEPKAQSAESPGSRTANNGAKTNRQTAFAVTLSLLNGRSGEESGGIREIVIPSGYESLELQVSVKEHSSYSSYEMVVKTVDGETVARLKKLKKGKAGTVQAAIPTKQLPDNDCVLILYGEGESVQSAQLGETFFRVKRS